MAQSGFGANPPLNELTQYLNLRLSRFGLELEFDSCIEKLYVHEEELFGPCFMDKCTEHKVLSLMSFQDWC